MSSSQPNIFLLAADNPSQLLKVLRGDPSVAASQDEHGYSLLHAATSYNHLELVRALVNEFHVDVDLEDEDGESALFVAETVDCAKLLVEELRAKTSIRGADGQTPREKIANEGDFPEVAVYLRMKELEAGAEMNGGQESTVNDTPPPPLPPGIKVNIGSMAPEDVGQVVDTDFRRRIEELASREDFQGAEGQRELRVLIEDALRGQVGEERNVRSRAE